MGRKAPSVRLTLEIAVAGSELARAIRGRVDAVHRLGVGCSQFLLFPFLQDLVEDDRAPGADERPEQYAVLAVRHRANGRSRACAGAHRLGGTFHGMMELAVGTDDVLIRTEQLV